MISNNEMLFNNNENICGSGGGCIYNTGNQINEFNCPRGNYGWNASTVSPQHFCGFSRNNYYSPVVQCYNAQEMTNLYNGNRYSTPNSPYYSRIRFEKIEELIK
jgi:hypothetical protein